LQRVTWLSIAVAAAIVGSGCGREATPTYESNKTVQSLPAKVQEQIRAELEKYVGTPIRPKLIGNPAATTDHLAHGAQVYRLRCAACHGTSGDGNGPAAKSLHPLPRDYRLGLFKFTSTTNGQRPLRDDLLRTIRRGIRGTSMPAFGLLPDADLQAVVDYVLVLTHRGELETLLAEEGDNEGEIDPAATKDFIQSIVRQWELAKKNVVFPKTAEPPYTRESIELGREAFTATTGDCFKCHDKDGSARVTETVGKDPWGHPARAADITSGMLHGGATSEDLYRRIYSGITPMPSFADKYADHPEIIWHLVHFVQYTSGARRRDVVARQASIHKTPDAPAPATESKP
jgi:mono/diheme cytochrome c family protein